MVDYRKMYLRMAREVARATDILLAVQRECEEMYVEADDGRLVQLREIVAGDDVRAKKSD